MADDGDLLLILRERHVNMMAFSGCVGVGLFLLSGKAIFLAGPGLGTLAFLVAGSIMWCATSTLGEMVALFPKVKGNIFIFPRRFLDEGVGYAVGWMAWYSQVTTVATLLLAVATLFSFHFKEAYLAEVGYPDKTLGWAFCQTIQPAVWITLFYFIILLVNCFPVLWLGRLEYFSGCMKMVFVVGLIILNIIISALDLVPHQYGRFWTYNDPYGFTSQNITIRGSNNSSSSDSEVRGGVISGNLGIFLGFWSATTTVMFSMTGMETVAITAPENKDLEKNESIKMATRKIVLRVVLLYFLATATVSFNVPYTDMNLLDLDINSLETGNHSAFIIAVVRNHIRILPHILNGFFIFSAASCGIIALYNASRILHALASTPDPWPRQVEDLRLKLSRLGRWNRVPYVSVIASSFVALLSFLGIRPNPAKILGRMATSAVVSMLIVYAVICLSYFWFHELIRQAAAGNDARITNPHDYNREGNHYPYKSHGQRLKALCGFIGCTLIIVFNGWRACINPFSWADFIASYISILIFVCISLAYRLSRQGWNPCEWSDTAVHEIQNPPPATVTAQPRIGVLEVAPENGAFDAGNIYGFGKWIWQWTK